VRIKFKGFWAVIGAWLLALLILFTNGWYFLLKSGWGFRFGEIASFSLVILGLIWSLRQPRDVGALVMAVPLLGLLAFWTFLVNWQP